MKKFLKSKKGVTILEGLIALTLLALVATGTFAVLLSTSRKTSQPDTREEMALAVEKASQLLQVYIYSDRDYLSSDLQATVDSPLCEGYDASAPLATGVTHNIVCLLPPLCDRNKSYFTYIVRTKSPVLPRSADLMRTRGSDGSYTGTTTSSSSHNLYEVSFDISCNGFTL